MIASLHVAIALIPADRSDPCRTRLKSSRSSPRSQHAPSIMIHAYTPIEKTRGPSFSCRAARSMYNPCHARSRLMRKATSDDVIAELFDKLMPAKQCAPPPSRSGADPCSTVRARVHVLRVHVSARTVLLTYSLHASQCSLSLSALMHHPGCLHGAAGVCGLINVA